MLSGDIDPSEPLRGAGASTPYAPAVTFSRRELDRILGLYGRMVAAGEWRDYAIDFLKDRAVFSIFRRSAEVPIYRVEKESATGTPPRCLQRNLGDWADHAPRSRAGARAGRARQYQARGGELADQRGGAAAPGPSERCISTVSSQRPNLNPVLANVPTMWKPSARCSSIDPAFAESPITAIICR